MPCKGPELTQDKLTIEGFKINHLLIEFETGDHVDPESYRSGEPNQDGVYSLTDKLSKQDVDYLTNALCENLRHHTDISCKSLEMQMWWRDHQEEDKKRTLEELDRAIENNRRQQALGKLSNYEKRLLGLYVSSDKT